MAYTRSKAAAYDAPTKAAAQTLINMRYSMPLTKSNVTRFWTNWTNWYDAFVSEVHTEGYSPATARREAETRWVTFCAKTLKCDETEVRDWLETSH